MSIPFDAIVESKQHVTGSWMERARQLKRLRDAKPDMHKTDFAILINRSPSWVEEIMRLNDLHPDLQEQVHRGIIGRVNGSMLAKLPQDEQLKHRDAAHKMTNIQFRAYLKIITGPLEVVVDVHGSDHYRADIKGSRKYWGCGKTPSEAIGAMLIAQEATTGIKIEFTVNATTRIKRGKS